MVSRTRQKANRFIRLKTETLTLYRDVQQAILAGIREYGENFKGKRPNVVTIPVEWSEIADQYAESERMRLTREIAYAKVPLGDKKEHLLRVETAEAYRMKDGVEMFGVVIRIAAGLTDECIVKRERGLQCGKARPRQTRKPNLSSTQPNAD